MRVAISKRIAKHCTVGGNAKEVASPCVDTYTGNLDPALCRYLQSIDDFGVEGIYVPIHMSSGLDEVVVETSEFFLLYLAIT